MNNPDVNTIIALMRLDNPVYNDSILWHLKRLETSNHTLYEKLKDIVYQFIENQKETPHDP